jgi:hypothetical protein
MSNRKGQGQQTERLLAVLGELRTARTFLAVARVQERHGVPCPGTIRYWEDRIAQLEQELSQLKG